MKANYINHPADILSMWKVIKIGMYLVIWSLFTGFDSAALPVVKGAEHWYEAEEKNAVWRNTSYSIRNGKQVRVMTRKPPDLCLGLN